MERFELAFEIERGTDGMLRRPFIAKTLRAIADRLTSAETDSLFESQAVRANDGTNIGQYVVRLR